VRQQSLAQLEILREDAEDDVLAVDRRRVRGVLVVLRPGEHHREHAAAAPPVDVVAHLLEAGHLGRVEELELDLPDTQSGRDLAVLSKRGTVRGVSFAFTQMRDSWHLDGGQRIRTVHEVVGIKDISPTHRPAYPDTTLAIRSLENWESAASCVNDLEARVRRNRLAEISLSL
jgi:Caudovirus prohead serine protease